MDFLCPSSIIEAVLIRLADLTQVILNLQSWKLDFLDKIKRKALIEKIILFSLTFCCSQKYGINADRLLRKKKHNLSFSS